MNERFSINPNIQFGKLYINRTRITVQNVLELINEGISFEEIKTDYYPDLETSDIKGCLDYVLE